MFKSFLLVILIFILESNFIIKASTNKKYLSIRSSQTNVRLGPSYTHPVIWIYEKKNMPVEIINEFEVWRKIRDFQGEIGWIHLSQLSRKRTLLTVKDNGVLFKEASVLSQPLIRIGIYETAVIKKCYSDWCKIEIQKYRGWIQKEYLWGVELKEIIN